MPDELRWTLHLCGFKHQHSVSIKPTSSNIFLVWTRELLATISMKRPFSFSHECCDLKMRWLGENFVFLLLNLHPHFLLPVFPEQYESFVKFTQDQIMRRYGARPASCKYLKPPLSSEIIRVHFLFYLPSQGRSDCYLVWPQHLSTVSIIFCFRCLLNSHDETPPPPQLPLTRWLLFYCPVPLDFHFIYQFFSPPPSQTVWVPWFILFLIQKLISYFATIAAGQKSEESER